MQVGKKIGERGNMLATATAKVPCVENDLKSDTARQFSILHQQILGTNCTFGGNFKMIYFLGMQINLVLQEYCLLTIRFSVTLTKCKNPAPFYQTKL